MNIEAFHENLKKLLIEDMRASGMSEEHIEAAMKYADERADEMRRAREEREASHA